MRDQIIILTITFLLTTVAGGLLAAYFQNRTWKHQNRLRLVEAERAAATQIFESISSLMDKRLYRMRQLNWKIRDDTTSAELLEMQMSLYRKVLYEWNDNLNRNLALTECYFGKTIRNKLEGKIYEKFREIGMILETGYVERLKSGEAEGFKKQSSHIAELRDDVYKLNVDMVKLIQKGEVGVFNPDNQLKLKSPLLDL